MDPPLQVNNENGYAQKPLLHLDIDISVARFLFSYSRFRAESVNLIRGENTKEVNSQSSQCFQNSQCSQKFQHSQNSQRSQEFQHSQNSQRLIYPFPL